MNRTNILMDSNGQFSLVNFNAEIDSETECSICLGLWHSVHKQGNLSPEEAWLLGGSSGTMFKKIGWIDLHYPCVGHRRAFICACLPKQYLDFKFIKILETELFRAFEIPENTLGVIYYFSMESMSCLIPNDELGQGT